MGRSIRFTKRADRSFENTIAYLKSEFGETTAQKFKTRFYKFLDIIPDYPQIGTLADESRKIYSFLKSQQQFSTDSQKQK